MAYVLHMTPEGFCNLVAAIAALGAAGAWFRSARAPTPFISFPESSDPEAVNAAIQCYQGFVRGTVWNQRAAVLAGISAFSSFAAWAVS
jgi:hypothetical protein